MKILSVLTLCLVVLMVTAFPFERKGASPTGGAAKEKRVHYAARDDVNIIAHGLLQLGQNLKEHVDKTKGQMRDIFTKLKAFNRTMTELGNESQSQQEEGENMKAKAMQMEDREKQLLNVTAELREKLEEMQKEKKTMNERMSRLEERVDSMLQGHMSTGARNSSNERYIQHMVETQNRRIDDLVERIRLQQEKLDKQNMRIRTLQSQIQLSGQRPSPRSSNSSSSTEGPVQSGAEDQQRDTPLEMATDCHELYLRGETTSGVYSIQPFDSEPFNVLCEMTADGGWTVIQRRQDGSVDFDQLWQAYEKGFGSLNGEFWLGLENIHAIAKDSSYILNIKFSDWGDDSAFVRFPFELGGRETNYSLLIQEDVTADTLESSLTTDSALSLPFSTRDQDNDRKVDINCAKHLSGGWWFSNCGRSNLNGRYFQSPPPKQRHQRKQGIFWKTWRGRYYPLKSSIMMIAPAAITKS
ncbi:angiopoietin-related protein 4 [Girardinichthys multiradiatus]|uniref:angiopoietin-related protein 4 n=1 Tax=Girardinichthys multiradiatus TaxID=208333 RepID=UPI001FADE8FD|nr:angiopoietin-related protein 4 [Girardinichthys multiradiatus]